MSPKSGLRQAVLADLQAMLRVLDPGAAQRQAGNCPKNQFGTGLHRGRRVLCQAAAGQHSHRKVQAAILNVVGMQTRPASTASKYQAGGPAGEHTAAEHTAAKQLLRCPSPEECECTDDGNNSDLQRAADAIDVRQRGTRHWEAQTLWQASLR